MDGLWVRTLTPTPILTLTLTPALTLILDEPWASGFNFAFFQRAQFAAESTSSFEMAVLPIDKGLSPDKSDKQLRETVEAAVTSAGIQLEPTQPGLGPLPGQK